MDHPNADPEFTNFLFLPDCFLSLNTLERHKENAVIFKEPLLELTIHGHGGKYAVLSDSMKPQNILANTVFMKRNCKHRRARNKIFCFPLFDRPIENGPDPKTFFMI